VNLAVGVYWKYGSLTGKHSQAADVLTEIENDFYP
jgi:hypothetical protein